VAFRAFPTQPAVSPLGDPCSLAVNQPQAARFRTTRSPCFCVRLNKPYSTSLNHPARPTLKGSTRTSPNSLRQAPTARERYEPATSERYVRSAKQPRQVNQEQASTPTPTGEGSTSEPYSDRAAAPPSRVIHTRESRCSLDLHPLRGNPALTHRPKPYPSRGLPARHRRSNNQP
jgi:hypothetical protein